MEDTVHIEGIWEEEADTLLTPNDLWGRRTTGI